MGEGMCFLYRTEVGAVLPLFVRCFYSYFVASSLRGGDVEGRMLPDGQNSYTLAFEVRRSSCVVCLNICSSLGVVEEAFRQGGDGGVPEQEQSTNEASL